MNKSWSARWLSSIQPRKQRKYRHNAPLHVRQGFVSANLSPELRKRYSKRSMQLRKGDEIKVMRGTLKGKTGVVERVDIRKSRIYVDEFKVKKVDGSEIQRSLEPSNLMITKLKLDDKKRQAILERAGTGSQARPVEKGEEVKKAEPKKADEKPAAKKPPAKEHVARKAQAKKAAAKPKPKEKPARKETKKR